MAKQLDALFVKEKILILKEFVSEE